MTLLPRGLEREFDPVVSGVTGFVEGISGMVRCSQLVKQHVHSTLCVVNSPPNPFDIYIALSWSPFGVEMLTSGGPACAG